jgi:hypothetical protein
MHTLRPCCYCRVPTVGTAVGTAVVQPFTLREQEIALRRRAEYLSREIQTRCRRVALLCELGGDVAETVDRLADAHTRCVHTLYLTVCKHQ